MLLLVEFGKSVEKISIVPGALNQFLLLLIRKVCKLWRMCIPSKETNKNKVKMAAFWHFAGGN